MCKGNAGRGRGHGRLCLLEVSEASPVEGIVQRGNYWGSRGHNDSAWGKGKFRCAHGTEDSDLPGAGWLSAPLCQVNYLIFFQMSQEEEDVLVLSLEDSNSECFDTVEAGSSADEMDDCLSVLSAVEGLAVAEATGPKISKVPAGTEAPGSDDLIESPAARSGERKIREEVGMGLAGQSAVNGRSSVVTNPRGGLCRGKPEGNWSHPGTPPVWGVLWRGVGSG